MRTDVVGQCLGAPKTRIGVRPCLQDSVRPFRNRERYTNGVSAYCYRCRGIPGYAKRGDMGSVYLDIRFIGVIGQRFPYSIEVNTSARIVTTIVTKCD